MKKVFVVALVLSFLSVGFANAEIKQKVESWKPNAEFIFGVHNAYVDELSGYASFKKAVLTQSATISIEKNGTGFYVQSENFSSSEKESREIGHYCFFHRTIKA